MSEARDGYKSWLADALMNGSRAAHRVTCAEWTPPRATVTCGVGNLTFETPALAFRNRTETWSRTWQRNTSEEAAGSDALIAARVKVLRDGSDLIEWATFERAINASRGASGVGGDFIENALIKGAPKVAKQAYLSLLHTVQAECRWPRQAYLNMVALIGKNGGGERAVGLMFGAYRIFC